MASARPEHATAELSPSKPVQEIIKEAKRIEESSLFSAKGHFAAAEAWSRFHLGIGLPNAVLAALAGAIALSFTSSSVGHIIAGILSIVAAGLAGLQTFLNPNERAAAHLNAGNNYEALCGKVRIFWTVECWEENSERVLTEKLKDFADQKEKLNRTCPQIPSWAYRKAKKGIEAGEGRYSVDEVAVGTDPKTAAKLRK
jgi:hypothetical protein